MADNSGGSCEPCKKKKCKCDRKLPSCSQCANSQPNLKCKYAEGNKRGIPTGYLGTLEQRLAETETALFNTLNALGAVRNQEGNISQDVMISREPGTMVARDTNVNKTGRMAEWKRYPLQSSTDLEEWYEFFQHTQQESPVGAPSDAHTLPTATGISKGVSEDSNPELAGTNFGTLNEVHTSDPHGTGAGGTPNSGDSHLLDMRTGSRPPVNMNTRPLHKSPPTTPSHLVPRHAITNSIAIPDGAPEGVSNLNSNISGSHAVHATSLGPSRPDGMAQPTKSTTSVNTTHAATQLSASQNLAATFRNRYY